MVFSELIEKINALEGHVFFKDDIIELIKACEPQELDAPDSEGWWWIKLIGSDVCYCVELVEGLIFWECGVRFNWQDVDNCKWIKAITPK